MRLATLSFSLVTLFAATVLAQEIIAPEEWFESMKVAQGLVARHDKRHPSRRHRTTNGRHHHHKSNNNHKNYKVVTSSGACESAILQEPIVGPEVNKMEMEKVSKKAGKKAMKRAPGKGATSTRRDIKKVSSSSTSKKHLSQGKKTNSKKASS
ncbi:hypothetical protein F5H01DRAFT_369627 [Linnemannia elongata]|nr:hypothetical protein F5H01DRAFT_369627 [Linnemannia elongata]